jgi:hypothetical protein
MKLFEQEEEQGGWIPRLKLVQALVVQHGQGEEAARVTELVALLRCGVRDPAWKALSHLMPSQSHTLDIHAGHGRKAQGGVVDDVSIGDGELSSNRAHRSEVLTPH